MGLSRFRVAFNKLSEIIVGLPRTPHITSRSLHLAATWQTLCLPLPCILLFTPINTLLMQ
jgi:hypothetical protein